MRFPWQSSSPKKTAKTTGRLAKKLKKKFQPTLELLEKRELMATAIINVNTTVDTQGTTGLPALTLVSGGVDYYAGSLREAINLTNQNVAGITAYTINLSGGSVYQITLPDSSADLNAGGAFEIRSAESVTIVSVSGGNAIVSGGSGAAQDRVFDIGPKSHVTLEDLTIQGGLTTGAGGGIRSAPGSIVLLQSDLVQDNTASVGGGIAAGYTGMNLSGGTLTIGTAHLTLGPLAAGVGGSLSLSGGNMLVDSNDATGVSGGIAAGGGIASSGESLGINNASIDGNTAGSSLASGQGGGLYVVDPTHHFTAGTNVILTDLDVSNNIAGGISGGAAGQGGGLYLSRLDTASITDTSFDTNTAGAGSFFGAQGGGAYLTSIHAVNGGGLGGTVLFNDTFLHDNTAGGGFSGGASAGGQGGGAWIGIAENVQYSGGGADIAGNQAFAANSASGGAGKGGGIYATGAIVSLTDAEIGGSGGGGNIAHGQAGGGSGGGIYFSNLGEVISGATKSTLTITASTIQNNTAEGGGQDLTGDPATNGGQGGGVFLRAFGAYTGGTQATITGTNIQFNRALGGFSGGTGGAGGGLYISPSLAVSISGGSISSNTAGGASAGNFLGTSSGHGGGIYADGAILNLTNVTIGSSGGGNIAEVGSKHLDSDAGGQGGEGGGIFFTDLGKVLSGSILSTLTVSGGNISNNIADGGFSGGAPAEGGGIYAQAFGSYSGGIQVTLNNVTIEGNLALGDFSAGPSGRTALGGEGGGMFINANVYVAISGGAIVENVAGQGSGGGAADTFGGGKGGGIFADAAIIKLTNAVVAGNTAGGAGFDGGSGGGIYFAGLGDVLLRTTSATISTLTISGGSITGNVASGGNFSGGHGGGIYATSFGSYSGGVQISINNVAIAGNTASGAFSGGGDGAGGGIYIGGDLSATISNSELAGNTAGGGLGGIDIRVVPAKGSFNEGGEGGGIFVTHSVLVLTNDAIEGNTALAGFSGGGGAGGGILASDLGATIQSASMPVLVQSSLTISGGSVIGNLAQGGGAKSDSSFSGGGYAAGGGILAFASGSYSGGTQLSITGTSINGNTAQGGFSGGHGAIGGGMYIGRDLSANITNATIAGNTAGGTRGYNGFSGGHTGGGGGQGGAIFAKGAIVVLTSTTVGGPSVGDGNVAQGGISGGRGGAGGGIFATELGQVLNGGTIKSSLTISGGSVSGNQASGGDLASFNFSGGGFAVGGGIYAQSSEGFGSYSGGTQVNITNASILGNTAQGGTSGGHGGAGGGIFLNTALAATITGSTIQFNTATGATGGEISTADIANSKIAGRFENPALAVSENGGGAGGGIFAQADILLLLNTNVGSTSGGGNVAEWGDNGDGGAGGGIFDRGLGFQLSGTTPSTVNATLTISGGGVKGNLAEGGAFNGAGGGILATTGFSGGAGLKPAIPEFSYSGGTQVNITGVSITGNTAEGSFSGGGGGVGGGILLSGPMSVSITNSTISSNAAYGASFNSSGGGGAGGGIFSVGTILQLTNTTVGGVSAGNFAGGSGDEGGSGGGIFAVELGVPVSATAQSKLTISGGSISNNVAQGSFSGGGAAGGGIFAEGFTSGGTQVSITNVMIKGNTASGAFSGGEGSAGGGIFLEDGLAAAITGTTISGNVATGADIGGGSGGSGGGGGVGGGLFADGSIVQLTNSTVSGNLASGDTGGASGGGGAGGGIFAVDLGSEVFSPGVTPAGSGGGGIISSTLTITASTISGNSATNGSEFGSGGGAEGGGIFAGGDDEFVSGGALNITSTTITQNYIGPVVNIGLKIKPSDDGEFSDEGAGLAIESVQTNIFASTIDHNTIGGSIAPVVVPAVPNPTAIGAGVYIGEESPTSIINSTIAFNSVSGGAGGGLFTTDEDAVQLVNDTVAYNVAEVGGGVYRTGSGGGAETSLLNTIVAKNFTKASGGTETDVWGSLTTLGNNIIGTNVGAAASFTESTFVAAGVGGNTNIHHTANSNGDFVGGALHGPLSTYEVGLATALALNQLPAPFGVPLTLTLALQKGSLAIENGNSSASTLQLLTISGGTHAQDERGPTYTRIAPAGSKSTANFVDIGAFQVTRGGDDT